LKQNQTAATNGNPLLFRSTILKMTSTSAENRKQNSIT
jgi:hypothetical protein